MLGTIDIKSRPLKLAYLVDPRNTKQVREAIRLSSSLWGGDHFPIIPLHKRMPATWGEKPLKPPSSKSVILGYLEAYDPDVLVQFSQAVPNYITDIGLRIVKPEEIWTNLNRDEYLSPKFGLGIFELLNDIFEEYFKFKIKYPVEVILPKTPKSLSLFWASWLGEIHPKLLPKLKKHYFKPLDTKTPEASIKSLKK